MRFRVTHGWDLFSDFATEREAILFAAEQLAAPMADPAMRRVSILSLTEREHGCFRALLRAHRLSPGEYAEQMADEAAIEEGTV